MLASSPKMHLSLKRKGEKPEGGRGKVSRAPGLPCRDGAGGLGFLPGGVPASFHHSARRIHCLEQVDVKVCGRAEGVHLGAELRN